MSQTVLTSIKSRCLVSKAFTTLRDRILDGEYGLDGELPAQGAICREFGVSRSVVREAMQQLQSRRLISISQGRKPQALPPSCEAITDDLLVLMRRSDASLPHLAEVRLALEGGIAALAAERITSADVQQLHGTIAELYDAADVPAQVEADFRFHRILSKASGNPIFVFLLDSLAELLRQSGRSTIGRGGIEPALAGHREILAAVERGDAVGARKAMIAHLQASARDLEDEARETNGKRVLSRR